MSYRKIVMRRDKKIALVAHDNKKRDLVEWASENSPPVGGRPFAS